MSAVTTATQTMQQARAQARYVRITPRKVRLVVDAIRGRRVQEAEALLKFIPKGAAAPVAKVLRSAKANAVNNHDMIEDSLVVKFAFVDEGPTLKRILPRARGRGDYMMKRTSHITIILEEAPVKAAGRRGTRRAAAKSAPKAASNAAKAEGNADGQ